MELLFRTGQARADDALTAIVAAFEEAFPKQARFVLLGSYATGNPRESSDLDLIVLFRERLSDERRASVDRLKTDLVQKIAIDADIAACSVADCPPVWAVGLSAGRTVFGDESIVPKEPTIEAYTQALLEDVRALMQALRPGQSLALPLDLPNPALALFGYEAKPLRGPDGRWSPSTKALSMITFWGASALIALRAGQYVATKDEVIALYRNLIGDEWTDLLATIERLCRHELAYTIPTDPTRVAQLRELAQQVLRFENYLLETFSAARD